ncbi:MAG: hypothetical protein PHH69_03745 [Candidatus Omnitrophica bacterium]|nr:hypothetical protein [Candidatus Omnitrophota bacterium]
MDTPRPIFLHCAKCQVEGKIERVKKALAYEHYEYRQENFIAGSPEDDWFWAERKITAWLMGVDDVISDEITKAWQGEGR